MKPSRPSPYSHSIGRDSTISHGGDSVDSFEIELLGAMAAIVREGQSTWVKILALCEKLKAPADKTVRAIDQCSWCTHINGYVRVKGLHDLFLGSPRKLANVPRDVFALARTITSAAQPLVPRRVLAQCFQWNFGEALLNVALPAELGEGAFVKVVGHIQVVIMGSVART